MEQSRLFRSMYLYRTVTSISVQPLANTTGDSSQRIEERVTNTPVVPIDSSTVSHEDREQYLEIRIDGSSFLYHQVNTVCTFMCSPIKIVSVLWSPFYCDLVHLYPFCRFVKW